MKQQDKSKPEDDSDFFSEDDDNSDFKFANILGWIAIVLFCVGIGYGAFYIWSWMYFK